MRDTNSFASTGKPVRDTDLLRIGKHVRGVESISNVERSLSQGERNRELESVQLSQMGKEKILSEQRGAFMSSLKRKLTELFKDNVI